MEHLDTLLEVELDHWRLTFEWLKWVLLLDDVELILVSRLDSVEEEDKHVGERIKNLKVMLLDVHLHIETGELAEMTVGVGIFGSEDGTNFKDSFEVTTEGHLLVKLWALGHASVLSEVLKVEHVGTTLGCSSEEFWRVDLNEVILEHELSVEAADARLKLEDSLVGWHSQVDDSIVQSDILLHNGELGSSVLGILIWTAIHLSGLVGHESTGIVNLERKNWS